MANEDVKGARLAVFTVVDLDGAKALWRRIGNAFENRDGSINVYLDALPVNGKLHIRRVADELNPKEG